MTHLKNAGTPGHLNLLHSLGVSCKSDEIIRVFRRHIYVNGSQSPVMMKAKYMKESTFTYLLGTVETGRHFVQTTIMTFVFDAFIPNPKFFAGYLHLVDELHHYLFIRSKCLWCTELPRLGFHISHVL